MATAPAEPAWPGDAPVWPGDEPAPPTGWGALRHPVRWLQAHPLLADGTLAALVAGVAVIIWIVGPPSEPGVRWRDPDLGLALVIALSSVPLIWRRRRPLLVLGLTVVAAMSFGTLEYDPDIALFGDLVALYTVSAHCGRRASRLVLAGFFVVIGPVMLAGPGPEGGDFGTGEIVFAYLMYGTVWLVGDNLQTRRANVAALRERAERAEHDRQEEARRAVEEERNRIAREMHDVVAHSMSVMVVQASGARRVLDREPARAERALELIEQTGREGLAEMRRLLGVLREEDVDGAPAARAPQPSLDRLDDLVEECRAAGLPVALDRRGEARPLPPGVDLAAFRIVQEALTNVRRHAGPASAGVTITYTDGDVEVEVADDGRGLGADRPAAEETGHGLVGMRERVALYGGSVRAGPRPGGGFAVRARLPLDAR